MLDLTVEENIGDGSKIMQLTAVDADEVTAFPRPRIPVIYPISTWS